MSRCLVLLLDCHSPVVVEPVIPADDEKAAIIEERIFVKIAVAKADLEV
jgi:hypothetical protein